MPNKLTIEEMRRIAKKKGGKCLSDKYIDNKTTLKWQCKEGHVWMAKAHDVKHGTWCSVCSIGISERICRNIFEIIFNERFPKLKPKWLLGPKGKRLELDGYCKMLGIAFEYQGRQHYVFSRLFSKGRNVKLQRKYDRLKKYLCKQHDVILIAVPYTVDFEKMPEYIIQKCKDAGIKIPKITKSLDYRLMNIYSPQKIKEMRELARENDGKCLSDRYINSQTTLKWQCKEGHEWPARPNDVKQGQWCPHCSHNVRLGIEKMRELAKSFGGLCLSKKYINNRRKLKWQCAKGHIWKAVPGSVVRGHWCSLCSKGEAGKRRRLTIEKMQEFAKSKGGECLSSEYKSAKENLKWKCAKSHVWLATPDVTKNKGQWCKICAKEKRSLEHKVRRECEQCGKNFYVRPYVVRQDEGRYCSKACYHEASRRHYKKPLNSKEIARLYVEERKPATWIAKEYGCGYNQIYDLLRQMGIQPRSASEAKKVTLRKHS